MRVVFVTSIFFVSVFVSGGCGSDGSAGGSATLSPTTTASYCESACDQALACDPQNNQADCISGCMEDGAMLRGSVFVDIYECRADLACGVNDDTCDPVAIEPLAVHDRYQTDCTDVLTTCEEQQDIIDGLCGTGVEGDMAEELPLLGTDVVEQLQGCLELACADIPDCIDDVVEL